MIRFTSYTNGTIRDAAGKLVAHYDAETGNLNIDGVAQTLRAADIEHAMDLVAANV